MASTNFKIFNEDHTKERTFNDSEYANATQRQSGVIPGIALSRLHNKLYFQVSSMCKAIADFIVGKGYDCNDNDVQTITANLGKAILANGEEVVKSHNEATDAHGSMTSTIKDTLVPTSDTDTLRNQVSELANRIKAATGASDWKEAPAATLASLSTMIANLATGADVTWYGKKFTNHRLGITGLMDNNGYICFGPNFGGLIIQWGSTAEGTKTSFDVKLNITMTVICAIPYDISTKASSACYLCYIDSTATSLTFGANTVPYGYGWIAIGKQ